MSGTGPAPARAGTGFVRLGVLGDPLRYTRSPELHRAGLAVLGLAGDSIALPTPPEELAARLAQLRAEGYRGVNLTIPHKRAGLDWVDDASPLARRARSVNTIGFDAHRTWGDTTDGPGFLAWLGSCGLDPSRLAVVLLGAGGAARSLAVSLVDAGSRVTASARRPEAQAAAWSELAPLVAWRSDAEAEALAQANVVVNATPLDDPEAIAPWTALPQAVRLMDLRYGPAPTPWVATARRRGLAAEDGLGLLVQQARLSLERWLGVPVPLEPLEQAVGRGEPAP